MLAAVSYYFPDSKPPNSNPPDPDSKWDAVSNVSPDVMAWLIINPNSGPGYGSAFAEGGTVHKAYANQIAISQGHFGHTILAYVTTNYHDQDGTQRLHWFSASHANDSFTALRKDKNGNLQPVEEHGLSRGFGPVWVASEGALPAGLAKQSDYYIIPVETAPEQFRLADSESNAIGGVSVAISDDGSGRHTLAISRSPENIQNVRDEVDFYLQRYPTLQGIFFDEMNNDYNEENLSYYRSLYSYVKSRGLFVVQNPGTNFPESMVEDDERPVADTFMSFEGEFDAGENPYNTFAPESWQTNYPASNFWHCIKNVPKVSSTNYNYCDVHARWRTMHAEYIWIDEADVEYTAPPSYLEKLEELEAGTGDGDCPGI